MNGITMTKENIEVGPIANKVAGYLNAIANKKGITIENTVQDVKTNGDSNMIELVFRNLVANAIKYTNQNGKIKLTSTLNHDRIIFCVEDNGVGIPQESIPKLFRLDKTFTTLGTEKEKGSGLGLSLCKDFVERNDGTLWLESELGVGTKFFFTLPAEKRNKTN
jgi:signal transduction histidine kinase